MNVKPQRAFEIELASRMRAKLRVDELFSRMRLDSSAVSAARDDVEQAGLTSAPSLWTNYVRFLGNPTASRVSGETDVFLYQSELWIEMSVAISVYPNGYVADLSFERRVPLATRVDHFDALVPWHIVEGDVLHLQTAITEEWWPLRDVICVIDGRRFLLSFDFGLLQGAIDWPST